MFHEAQIERLVQQNLSALQELTALEVVLGQNFHGLERAIHGLILAVASGEPMILIGQPGTAKSMLVRTFAELIGIGGRDGEASGGGLYFEYLLTQFTEPSELFGYLNLSALVKGEREIRRDDAGMMQHAQVIFLDEVFNASSAILNALLTFMNERKFHDRGRVLDVRMQNLFAATNAPPRDGTLAAMFDRFLLRAEVGQAAGTRSDLAELATTGWRTTFERPQAAEALDGLMDRMRTFQSSIGRAARSGALDVDEGSRSFASLARLVSEARRRGISMMSNRRIIKFLRLVLIERMLAVVGGSGSVAIQPGDLGILIDYGLDRTDSGAEAFLRQDLETEF